MDIESHHSGQDLQCSTTALNPKLRRYLGTTKMVFGEIDPRHLKF